MKYKDVESNTRWDSGERERQRERNNDAKNNTEQANNCNQLTCALMEENLLCMYNGLLFIY